MFVPITKQRKKYRFNLPRTKHNSMYSKPSILTVKNIPWFDVKSDA